MLVIKHFMKTPYNVEQLFSVAVKFQNRRLGDKILYGLLFVYINNLKG